MFGVLLVDPARNGSSSPGLNSCPKSGPDSRDGGEKYPSQSPKTLPNQTTICAMVVRIRILNWLIMRVTNFPAVEPILSCFPASFQLQYIGNSHGWQTERRPAAHSERAMVIKLRFLPCSLPLYSDPFDLRSPPPYGSRRKLAWTPSLLPSRKNNVASVPIFSTLSRFTALVCRRLRTGDLGNASVQQIST